MEVKSKINISCEHRYRNINHPNKFNEPEINELYLPINQELASQRIFIYPTIVMLFQQLKKNQQNILY